MKPLIRKLSLSILVLFCLGYFSAVYADEAINNFVSDISINDNGSADISETITVKAEQKKIQYGIVRWMPRFFRDQSNRLTSITYFVSNVLLNNLPTPYHIIQNEKNTAVFIGSPNHLLAPGVYTYLIQYHIDNAVVLGAKSDQFYWNVTGSSNGWPVPINNVDATVHLPSGAFIDHYAGYTGKFDAQSHDYFVSSPLGTSQINFVTTRPLLPGEELTIGMSWPAGFIHKVPQGRNPFLQFIYSHGNAIALFFMVLLLCYFSSVWTFENRPPKRPVMNFQPPESMSPAALRYIQKMTFDNKALTVAIISMAVKGYLVIEKDEFNNFKLIKRSVEFINLSRAEQMLADDLFAKSDRIELNVKNHPQILQAQDDMKTNLRDEYEKTFFVTHASFLVPAFILGFCGIVALALASRDLSTVFFTVVMLMLAVFYLTVQMPKTADAIRDFARAPAKVNKIPVVGRLLVSLFLVMVVVMAILTIEDAVSAMGMLLITCIIYLEVLFYHLLKAHTPEGRKLMDEVRGFKMYLANTKPEIPNKNVTLPAKTIDQFEKYLPYAIALDAESRWVDQFTKVLTKASGRHGSYSPTWLVGSGTWQGHVTINSLISDLGEVWVRLYLAAVPRLMASDEDTEAD